MVKDETQATDAPLGEIDHRYVSTNGVALHVVSSGPGDGPLVIMLHGFPDFWYGWRRQIPALAKAGFAVWAPDQRGYNLSDKPKGGASYSIDVLVDDVIGLIDASGREKVSIVGHDWGGAVAWSLARLFPQRLEKLVILNSPHGRVFARMLKTSAAQRMRSAYMTFFQLPAFPEAILSLDDWRPLLWLLRRMSIPGTFTEAELAVYREAYARPRAMTSMLQWYRARSGGRPPRRGQKRITVPTLLLWGRHDSVFEPELAPESIALCDDGRLHWVEAAGHWAHLEQPDQVNDEIIAFLRN